MSSTYELEQMLLVAILDNSEAQHAAAQQYATAHNFSQEQINKACNKVTSFLMRLMKSNSIKPAVLKIQSFFRMLLVKKKLERDMQYWERLAKSDCVDHISKAEQIHKVLHRPNKKRKICI